MRKVFSIILEVVAGFFFYMVCLLAFVNEPPTGVKVGMLIGFSLPGVAALAAGLALTRFRNWRRHTGIVLLCGSGFTAFLVFSMACFFLTEEFRAMTRGDSLAYFSDYWTGGMVIAGLALLGVLLVKLNKKQSVGKKHDSMEEAPT